MPQTDLTPAQRRSLVEWLAGVMEWSISRHPNGNVYGRGPDDLCVVLSGNVSRMVRHWEPLDSWADAGQVWEKAREMGIMFSLVGDSAGWAVDDAESTRFLAEADSGPLTICLAIGRATGWEGGEDAQQS